MLLHLWVIVKSRPMTSEAFCWIWADTIAQNTSEFILILLSVVKLSINIREPVLLAALRAHTMTLPPQCFTDEVGCFGSWAVPFVLHTLLFPLIWYKIIFVSFVHRMLFQNCKGFFHLIVDFDTHTPTSWREFLILPTGVKVFFFTSKIILLLSTTIVFHGLPGLLVLLSPLVLSFWCT